MASTKALIDKEKRYTPHLLAVLTLTTTSGYVTYFWPHHGTWQQWTYLLHMLAGNALAIIILPYVVAHFRRTLGLRRPLVLIAGIFSALCILIFTATGLHIGIFGQMEPLRWVYRLHAWSSHAGLFLLGLHILLHALTRTTRRKQSDTQVFPTIVPRAYTITLILLGSGIIVIILATVLYSLSGAGDYQDRAAIDPYQLPYGDKPFLPSQTETSSGSFLDPRRLAGSTQCGTCHEEITQQWRASLHAKAASDKTYQTNSRLLAKKKGMASTRYCEGCHAPVALLSGQLSKGGRLDTRWHMEEGVSCISCHRIDRLVHLKGVGSYRVAPVNDYLFATSENTLLSKVHNYLINIQPRQHRKDMALGVLFQPQLCAACHAQFMDKDVNNWGWVKMQDEYTAWLNGPYSGQSQHTFAHGEIRRCQDCHMPLTPSTDPSANSKGYARSHQMPGSNTAIPWFDGDNTQFKLVTDFLQADKVRLSIEHPNRKDATRSDKPIDPAIATEKESPAYFYLGETVELEVIVTNAQVGHDFPGGTTDINEVWINFRVVDAGDNLIYESGGIEENDDVDPEAYFYRSIAIDRYGKHVWKHDLFNMVGDSFKRVIPAGSSDIVSYKFAIPSWAKSPLTASAVVRYRKFNNRYARWALQNDSIELPITDMARDALSLPVRYRREAEAPLPHTD